jgi:hypothetical protein
MLYLNIYQLANVDLMVNPGKVAYMNDEGDCLEFSLYNDGKLTASGRVTEGIGKILMELHEGGYHLEFFEPSEPHRNPNALKMQEILLPDVLKHLKTIKR